MTDTKVKPDIALLSEMVKWAGQDEADLNNYFTQLGWPEWNQELWAKQVRNGTCETACCIAGNVVFQSKEWMPNFVYAGKTANGRKYYVEAGVVPVAEIVKDDKGNDVKVPEEVDPTGENIRGFADVAQEILGINEGIADFLFNGDNDLSDIVLVATAIAKNAGESLDIPDSLANLLTTAPLTEYAGYWVSQGYEGEFLQSDRYWLRPSKDEDGQFYIQHL